MVFLCCIKSSTIDSSPYSSPIPSPPPTPPPTRLFPELDPALESAEFRQTVLRNFACPFRAESTCRHESSPEQCQFGHPETSPRGGTGLPIPDYVCIYHLIGVCHNPRKVKQIQTRAQGLIVLHGCTSAIHIDPAVMIDLDLFEQRYATIIAEYFQEEKTTSGATTTDDDDDFECCICFERIRSKLTRKQRTFALLEKCDHIFCGPCITEYRAQLGPAPTTTILCPMCRVPSKRMYLSERFIKSTSLLSHEKKRIFDSYKCQCCDN